MIDISRIKNTINTIVTKRSDKIIESNLSQYIDVFKLALRLWKTEVMMLLSTPHMESQVNISKYPQLRTGNLRRSLAYRSKVVTRKKGSRQVLLRTTINWNPDPKGIGEDYGETLNSGKRFRGKTFYGWKDRTYELLRQRIKQSIK
jgi:hypothetical protein